MRGPAGRSPYMGIVSPNLSQPKNLVNLGGNTLKTYVGLRPPINTFLRRNECDLDCEDDTRPSLPPLNLEATLVHPSDTMHSKTQAGQNQTPHHVDLPRTDKRPLSTTSYKRSPPRLLAEALGSLLLLRLNIVLGRSRRRHPGSRTPRPPSAALDAA